MKYFSSNNLRSDVRKIFWITIGWTLISVGNYLYGYATLKRGNCDLQAFPFGLYLQASILTGLIAGMVGGTIVTILWERWLRSKNYGLALLYMFLSFTFTFYLVSVFVNLFVYHLQEEMQLFERELWVLIMANQTDASNLQSYLFWLLVVMATLIILQVNDKYGPGMLPAFLLGKYFQPKREERIFMFLDLRSSTTIAESLGEERYFHFLRDVFKYATQGILNTKGQIYQYVGDEIVISWKMNEGIENANCLRCFFDVQVELRRRAAYYLENFGVLPEFKAGLHNGPVMAGEMGVVKRDIAFSGDVLNTTSRIQEKCNELGVDLLLSKSLLNELSSLPDPFKPQEIGDLLLRGKQQKVVLYTMAS